VTFKEVAEPGEQSARGEIDYWGITTLSLGLTALLVALDQVTDWGFGDPRVIGLFVVFVVSLAAFPFCERRMGEDALLPRELLGQRQFVTCCAAVPLLGTAFFVLLLYMPQFMQKLLGFSPLKAGVGLLPMMAVFGAVSFVAGTLYERLGARLSIAGGALCMTVGLFVVSFAGADSSYGLLAAGMATFGVGVGLFFAAATTAGVTAIDSAHASLAGGVIYTAQVMGASVGLGLITAIFTDSSQSHVHSTAIADVLTQQQEHAVNGILAGTASAHQLLAQFPHSGALLSSIARHAFTDGTQIAFRVATGLAAAAFLIVVVFMRGGPRVHRAAAPEPSAAAA